MNPHTLKFKVGLNLAIALSLAVVLFIGVVTWLQRNALIGADANHLIQLSEVVSKSVRFAMLQNQPAYVDTIIHDVAQQEQVDRIRIFDKTGEITHTSYFPELGDTVDRKAEGCATCHGNGAPLQELPQNKRFWIFTTPGGQRMLGTMQVIRNEPSCFTAACHHHSPNTPVLGVLDIRYPLADMDRQIRRNTLRLAGLSLAFVAAASLAVGLFIHRLVYLPLRDLEAGATRVSSGDLEQAIPVRQDDEFGTLATAFNAMTAALRSSRSELHEWARTLEQKVEQRTEELQIAQAEAARSEKLASVGLLASGIAHELNNPLTGVLTFSILLREKMEDGSPDAEDMDLVIRETRRCASIIKRLLDFAREKPPEKKYADLNRIIEETVRIVEPPANLRDIAIRLELDPNLPQVWADPDQVKQVIMNLLVNAQHAIDADGSIVIRTRATPQSLVGKARMAEMSVSDTGCGIPPENLKRIFDPFFTTKVAVGTGLGLSVSHSIVEAHGGSIDVESEVGKGSTFRVRLPLAEVAEPAEKVSTGGVA
ncbi:MAG TPA: ATP-binding protein [Acetobacteraceae bacterium]|nr:ATP-binding protein [Acetobacteraceae bacterium]